MINQERTRVLRVIARLNVGGPAIHATLLTERLDPSRYESLLVSGAEDASEGSFLDLQARTLTNYRQVPELGREIRGGQDFTALRSLVRLIREFKPHIVHTHTAKAGTLGRLAAWFCGVPVVVHTYHGHVFRGYFSPMKTRAFVAIERWLARRTSCLVAVSDQVRREVLECGIGRPDRFTIVPLGLDLDRYLDADARRGELRRELGVAANIPLIGIIARLVPIKAHEIFLQVAQSLARTRPDAQFVIVGDGERRQELESLAGQLGVRERTRFLGWRGDLDRIYADLDAIVLTSRNEGSPVALIEAMASGRPVVSTRVGGVPDLITDGQHGLLAPMDDVEALAAQVLRLLDSPALGAGLAAEGRERVRHAYSGTRLLADVDQLYRDLLAGGPRRLSEPSRRTHSSAQAPW
jgi:glycosyltransferase involved in cell wall biosynthesis